MMKLLMMITPAIDSSMLPVYSKAWVQLAC